MARQKKMQSGMMVELSQHRNGSKEWLPFIVTHVYDDGKISGVCLSGEPGALGWGGSRGTYAFDKVEMGNGMREYRVMKGMPQMEDAPEPEMEPPVDEGLLPFEPDESDEQDDELDKE